MSTVQNPSPTTSFTDFDESRLMAFAEEHATAYQKALPFEHIVIDNFMDPSTCQQALDEFPNPEKFDFYKYQNPLEKKLAFDQISKLPPTIAAILRAMNSPLFLSFLEKLTGIEGLIPDPYYRGGGIHQILRGGKLDVHIDFNIHPKLKCDRRLNALLYLNQHWIESYGGYFELWKGHQENGKHVLDTCEKKVLPIFNRFVVFSTSEKSYHGHPEPLQCPVGWSRKSLATYYYTNGRDDQEPTPAHSTTFIKRPEDPDDDELNELREKRNQGRLSSNISNATTS